MDYQLVVIRGRSVSSAVKLADGVTTAGRQEDCQLRIKSSQVSRKHCQLFEKHNMLLVKDLGSANGTFVNGIKIDVQRVLEPGDELGIGPVVFRVEKIGLDAPAKPTATVKPNKANDTAIVAGVVPSGSDDFEIDFDEEPTVAMTADVVDDFQLDFEDDVPPPTLPVAPTPPASAAPNPPAKKASPSLADSSKPAPAKKVEELPPSSKDETAADDAVADFLLGLKIDDDD